MNRLNEAEYKEPAGDGTLAFHTRKWAGWSGLDGVDHVDVNPQGRNTDGRGSRTNNPSEHGTWTNGSVPVSGRTCGTLFFLKKNSNKIVPVLNYVSGFFSSKKQRDKMSVHTDTYCTLHTHVHPPPP